jgi:hypothetical protein
MISIFNPCNTDLHLKNRLDLKLIRFEIINRSHIVVFSVLRFPPPIKPISLIRSSKFDDGIVKFTLSVKSLAVADIGSRSDVIPHYVN